ncbi:MucBP domain-containing protein, partial [Lactococcus sp. dk322]
MKKIFLTILSCSIIFLISVPDSVVLSETLLFNQPSNSLNDTIINFNDLSSSSSTPTDTGVTIELDYSQNTTETRSVYVPVSIVNSASYSLQSISYPIQSFNVADKILGINPAYRGDEANGGTGENVNRRTVVFVAESGANKKYFSIDILVHPFYYTLDPNNGNFINTHDSTIKKVFLSTYSASGYNIFFDGVSRLGYTFKGWTTEKDNLSTLISPDPSTNGYHLNRDKGIDLYAYWEQIPTLGASVIAHYQDESGNKIADDEIKSGNVGDSYTTTQKAITGYTFTALKAGSAP